MSTKKNICRFVFAQTISLFGSSLVQYAIIWYITLSTSSGKFLTISTICGFLPQIIIALFAGTWIDRMNRKKLIMIADSVIALATLFLAFLFMNGAKNIWFLFLILMIRSAGTGIQTPSSQALIPQITPKELLMKVNGIQSMLSSIMMFLSPVVGGAILSIATLQVTLFIDVITAIIGVLLTATVKIDYIKNAIPNKKKEVVVFMEGLSSIKKYPSIQKILCYQILVLILISPSAFLTPLMVSRTFGSEVWRLTGSEMTYSLGMIFGGVLITWWGGFKKRLNTTLLAGGIYGLLMIGMGLAPIYVIYLILNIMIGITAPCYNAPITVFIQETCEPSIHGRIFSLMQISTSCALPLGMIIFGPMADYIRIQWLILGTGIAVVFISFIFFTQGFQHKNHTKS